MSVPRTLPDLISVVFHDDPMLTEFQRDLQKKSSVSTIYALLYELIFGKWKSAANLLIKHRSVVVYILYLDSDYCGGRKRERNIRGRNEFKALRYNFSGLKMERNWCFGKLFTTEESQIIF